MRFLQLLALVLWLGGLCFFAFVVAPVAFSRLADAHEAGIVVGGTLRVLHLMGLACGVVLFATSFPRLLRGDQSRPTLWGLGIVLLMLVLTAYSQFRVLPEMERDRITAGRAIDRAEAKDPARQSFERLHKLSERLESAVLAGGLALTFLYACDRGAAAR